MPNPEVEPHCESTIDPPESLSRWGFALASLLLSAWATFMVWVCYRILTGT